MTRDDITALVTRLDAALAAHDVAASTALYAEDCVVESPMGGGTVTGRDAIERVQRAFFQASPDVTFQREALLVDGHRVADISTVTGTDIGGFMGLGPTGKPFHFSMVRFFTVDDQQIVHERRIYDFTGLLVQIGMLKAKPA